MDRDDEFKRQLAEVRDTTRDLITSVLLDKWPRSGAIIDFGLDSPEHYEALYYPIRNDEIMPRELDSALGHGENLTALVAATPSNPHKEIRFSTSWDGIFGRETPEGALSEEAKLMRTLSRFDVPPSSGDDAPAPVEEIRDDDRAVFVPGLGEGSLANRQPSGTGSSPSHDPPTGGDSSDRPRCCDDQAKGRVSVKERDRDR